MIMVFGAIIPQDILERKVYSQTLFCSASKTGPDGATHVKYGGLTDVVPKQYIAHIYGAYEVGYPMYSIRDLNA
jgi:hypothetical protein